MKLNEKDLEDIAIIYDDIREVYRRNKYFVDKELAEEFDKGVDNIMGELSSKLNSSKAEEEVNSSIVGCRYALIDLASLNLSPTSTILIVISPQFSKESTIMLPNPSKL